MGARQSHRCLPDHRSIAARAPAVDARRVYAPRGEKYVRRAQPRRLSPRPTVRPNGLHRDNRGCFENLAAAILEAAGFRSPRGDSPTHYESTNPAVLAFLFNRAMSPNGRGGN